MIPPSSYLVNSSGQYDRASYYADPASFHSNFATTIAPHLTTVINGAGWQPGFPRLMTNADLKGLIESQGGQSKLAAVQDVACDLEVGSIRDCTLTFQGGLEFLTKHTTIDDPHWKGPGEILVSSTDILPTELRELSLLNGGSGCVADNDSLRRFCTLFQQDFAIRAPYCDWSYGRTITRHASTSNDCSKWRDTRETSVVTACRSKVPRYRDC